MFYAESLSYYMVGRLSRVPVSFVWQDAWGSFLFYIPSPSDVGIVFLLSLTTPPEG